MARTTSAEVQEILTGYDSNISLTPFIDAANQLVTDVCTDSGYTDAKLERIEMWLAAHFYVMREKMVTGETAGKVSRQFSSHRLGFVFHNSPQGQMAMALDTAGNLAALSKRIEKGIKSSVQVTWLGKGTSDGEGDDDTT